MIVKALVVSTGAFYFEKKNGFTQIKKATENELFMNCIEQGDLPGSLWKQGILVI